MCKPTTPQHQASAQPPLQLLLSLKSYEAGRPNYASSTLTASFFILLLVLVEGLCKSLLLSYKDIHPILEDEMSRRILARHIGVDTFSCTICATLGWMSIHQYDGFYAWIVRGKKEAFPQAGYLNRILSYDPSCYRLCLFFLAYQIKNLYDTIIFDDGPEFIFHHVFAGVASIACLEGVVNFYPAFYCGLSEISTAVLCLLANFDDKQGVPGLADAFPEVKIGLAAVFVVTFLICRIITWPCFTYQMFTDINLAFKNEKDHPKVKALRFWLNFQLIANGSLTVLQIAWLGQIFLTVYEEAIAMGVI